MDAAITAKAALMQALTHGQGYGMELIERVKEASGGGLVLLQGSVYPALRELESAGLVRSFDAESAHPRGGGRPRRYFALTPEGLRVAEAQRRTVAGVFGLSD